MCSNNVQLFKVKPSMSNKQNVKLTLFIGDKVLQNFVETVSQTY